MQPGTVIAGDFRIVAPLAKGGMGEVFIADQLSTGKRRALKVMKRDLITAPGLLARFEQEARIGGRITSEHVVEVVGAGVDTTLGVPWLAMELLEGETLFDAIERQGALGWAEARAIFAQVGHGLGAAHRAGVVHRDIKPENVFISRPSQVGVAQKVKILDFGIAKLWGEAQSTNTGAMSLGTPRYMAPEQTGGQPITAATDVWALGLVVYRTLTGRYFWRHGAGAAGDSVMVLMREVLFEPIVPASRRAAEQGTAHLLPPGFDEWFARTVAREPGDRFAAAGVAMEALDALFAGAPQAQGRGPTLASRVVSGVDSTWAGPGTHPAVRPTLPGDTLDPTPPAPRRRGLVALLGVGAVVAAAGGIGAFVFLSPASKKRKKNASDEDEDEEDDEAPKKKPRDARTQEPTAKPLPPPPPPPPPQHGPSVAALAGNYTIVSSSNPGGAGRYEGTVTITATGSTVRVEWRVLSSVFNGVGFVDGGELVVGFGSGTFGVVAYKIDGGKLSGRYTSSVTVGAVDTQELTGAPGLSGPYVIVGGTVPATGTVTFTPAGDTHDVRADYPGGVQVIGSGIVRGDRVIVGWGPPHTNGGVIAYKLHGNELAGQWATHGIRGLGTENLKRV